MSRARARLVSLLILALCAPLHGCGQTGPLYLPEPEEQTEVPAGDDREESNGSDDEPSPPSTTPGPA